MRTTVSALFLLGALSSASALSPRGHAPIPDFPAVHRGPAATPPKFMRKSLAGPPEDFAAMAAPSPSQGGANSDSALVPVRLTEASDGTSGWEDSIPVDSPTLATFTVFTAIPADKLKVEFKKPSSKLYINGADLGEQHHSSGRVEEKGFGIGGNRVPSVTFYFEVPERGVWNVRVSAPTAEVARLAGLRASSSAAAPHMYMMVGNESPHTVASYVTSYESLKKGQRISFRAHVYDSTVKSSHADGSTSDVTSSAIPMMVKTADLALVLPDGSEEHFSMRDDGNSDDLGADDGVWGTTFDAKETGNYLAEVLVEGVNDEGHAFLRSSMHIVPVVRSDLSLHAASARSADGKRIKIALETNLAPTYLAENADVDATHRAYAQVWATPAPGSPAALRRESLVPVAWISGMTDLEAEAGDDTLAFELSLDATWLARAQATEPLELRSVRVQERNAWVPVATAASLQVSDAAGAVRAAVTAVEASLRRGAPSSSTSNVVVAPSSIEITREMRQGPCPFKSGRAAAYHRERGFAVPTAATAETPAAGGVKKSTSGRGGKLLLVHGYCAPESSFPAEQFTDPAVFKDLNQNRPTDLFARMVMEFGNKYPTFSIFAHSHGGLASTHLHSFYFSNLEIPEGENKPEGTVQIFSAGSPYQGCAAAGFLASIGGVIGVGCGTNADLTADGAKLWLSGVPPESQKDVWFYRTQYGTKHLINSCVLASNAVLGLPNDGVVGVKPSVLPHGVDKGVKKEYCHSVDVMNYPGMLEDTERNAFVNENATR